MLKFFFHLLHGHLELLFLLGLLHSQRGDGDMVALLDLGGDIVPSDAFFRQIQLHQPDLLQGFLPFRLNGGHLGVVLL